MNTFALAGLVTFCFQFIGFVAAAILKTETFYDVFGGLNFLLLAFLGFDYTEATFDRLTVLSLLYFISRSWLLLFLAWRAHKRGGDSRFDAVIDKPPLFFVYWMIQGLWVYLISMALLVVQTVPSDVINDLGTTGWILVGGFAFGIFLEVSSDIQKAVWVEAGRQGAFCRSGWWNYSRHPNYAGEVIQYWCAAGIAFGSGSDVWWLGALSPLFTMHILLNVNGTGIWNAEGKNLKRYYDSEYRQEYKTYRQQTSPLFPLIGYGSIPLPIKRVLLFEWERYEYRPSDKESTATSETPLST